MHPDMVAACYVIGVVSSHLNDSAAFGEREMMGRFIVTETHHMVSPIIQRGIAVLVSVGNAVLQHPQSINWAQLDK